MPLVKKRGQVADVNADDSCNNEGWPPWKTNLIVAEIEIEYNIGKPLENQKW